MNVEAKTKVREAVHVEDRTTTLPAIIAADEELLSIFGSLPSSLLRELIAGGCIEEARAGDTTSRQEASQQVLI